MQKTFSNKEAISAGWKQFKSNWKIFAGAFLVVIAVSAIFSASNNIIESAVVEIVGFFVQLFLGLGFTAMALKQSKNISVRFNDLTAQGGIFIQYILGYILSTIIIVIGFVLLIIPGIIWSIKYMFLSYAIVDNKKLSGREAMKVSKHLTKGVKWKLFGFMIVLFFFNLLGLLALGVGLLATLPASQIALAHVYNTLKKQTQLPPELSGADA